jgi:hypothetical protein
MTVSAPVASQFVLDRPLHSWLKTMRVAYLPGPSTSVAADVAQGILRQLGVLGHVAQERPTDETDVVLTTARFGEARSWRTAPAFQLRREFGLTRSPQFWTVIHARPEELAAALSHFERALAKDPIDLKDFEFPGLAPTAHRPLVEQGRRGGPILSVERLVQAQALCLWILLVVGDERPEYAYHFNLVGSTAQSDARSDGFYDDIILRMVTSMSADEVARYAVQSPSIPARTWERLATPQAMQRASLEFGGRDFFTEMVRIADLVSVPAMTDAVASQYSEGCFSTWEPALDALIATTTGSARPVDKGHLTLDDLAVVTGVQANGRGVVVRHVDGLRHDPPSSEGFEMIDLDSSLPKIALGPAWDVDSRVPVVRSKLHTHRGVAAFDPKYVEYVPLSSIYFEFPVTCGTFAQAQGVRAVFAQAQCLLNPDDPRQVAFTLLPTHGVFIVEKWVHGKAPFQVIWELMDAGRLQIDRLVPQGPMPFFPKHVS